MTVRKKKEMSEIVIDLTGPAGNAFSLLGQARKFARELGLDGKVICEEMQEGDYEHLVEVFDKHFGDFVVLER